MKAVFGTENILNFLDSLRILIEKQKEQLRDQISDLDNYEKIQEQLNVVCLVNQGMEIQILKGHSGCL